MRVSCSIEFFIGYDQYQYAKSREGVDAIATSGLL
jgi:hypothetical protein